MNAVTDGLWEQTDPLRIAGVLELGHRMTVIRLPSGGLVVHSPCAWNEALDAELRELGPVEWFLVPSAMHDLYLLGWARAFPQTPWLAPSRIRPRRLPVHDTIPAVWPAAFRGVLDALPLDGVPRLHEVAVLHRPSRTLIVADLVFNLQTQPSWAGRAGLRALGAYGRLASCRSFRLLVRDRAAFRRSVDRLLAADFDRLIVGHGDCVPSGAKQALRDALEWSR